MIGISSEKIRFYVGFFDKRIWEAGLAFDSSGFLITLFI